ncbi:MAG: IS3 family transposase, partial [Gammaproteobacteria bacterium]
SFFGLLKRERIRRKVYPTSEAANSDIFNYIELFYNSVRRHGYNDYVSPEAFEDNYFKKLASV